MKNKTYTNYYVSSESTFGSRFSQEGYSKYNERWQLSRQGKLPAGEEVYGYQQCLDHIKELREHVYDGKKHYKTTVFYIHHETVSTVISQVPLEDQGLKTFDGLGEILALEFGFKQSEKGNNLDRAFANYEMVKNKSKQS